MEDGAESVQLRRRMNRFEEKLSVHGLALRRGGCRRSRSTSGASATRPVAIATLTPGRGAQKWSARQLPERIGSGLDGIARRPWTSRGARRS